MEYLDVCDENGCPTGETVSRERAHREGILHRTAHVWVVRRGERDWQVLLQKRSLEKESYPGLYDTSSAGHIPAGEEPSLSALRELREELGAAASPEDLRRIGFFRVRYEKTFHGRLFRDNEAVTVYLLLKSLDEGTLTLQRGEVDEVRWFDLDHVISETGSPGSIFCVPAESLKLLRQALKAAGERDAF